MQRRTVVSVLLQLFRHLLHPVLAQRVDAGGDGLLTGGSVVHFAGAHQRDILAGAARFTGGRVDLGANAGNIFSNSGHGSFPFLCIQAAAKRRVVYPITLPSLRSAEVTITSSPCRSMLESSSADTASVST